MPVSLVMIVKNEKRMLRRCLDSVKDHVDEMIIVDTGSTDGTQGIALSYAGFTSPARKHPLNVQVLDFEWCNDFSAARNFGLEAANGDWILQLDADEELATGHDLLHELAADSDKDVYLINLEIGNDASSAGKGIYQSFSLPRLFRNSTKFRFHNPIHESLPAFEQRRTGQAPGITILHFGPALDSPEEVEERHRRNLEMLRQAIAKQPRNGYFFYMLAGEQAHLGDFESACRSLTKAIDLERDKSKRYVASAYRSLALQYMNAARLPRALRVLAKAQKLYPKYTDLFFLEAQIRETSGEIEAARSLYARCLELGEPPLAFETWGGTGSSLAQEKLDALRVGDGAESLFVRADEFFAGGRFAEAAATYERATGDSAAGPRVAASLRNLVICHLQTGQIAAARSTLSEAKSQYPHYTDLYFLEGEIYDSQGNTAEAGKLFRKCLELGEPPATYDTWGGTGSWRAREKLSNLSSKVQ